MFFISQKKRLWCYEREQILHFLKNGGKKRVSLQIKNIFICVKIVMVINLLVANVI